MKRFILISILISILLLPFSYADLDLQSFVESTCSSSVCADRWDYVTDYAYCEYVFGSHERLIALCVKYVEGECGVRLDTPGPIEIPEFSVLGASLVLLGAGYVIHKKRKSSS